MDDAQKEPTWAEVAAVLGVDVRALQVWRKREDAPQGKDVAAWLAYRDQHGLGESGPKTGNGELKAQKIAEEVRRLKLINAKLERTSIERAEVDALLHHVAAQQRSRLYQYLETELPPRCEGLSAAQLRPIFRGVADDLCDQMAVLVDKWKEEA